MCRYEDYLDSQITAKDICYLEDVEIVRTLVELGYGLRNTYVCLQQGSPPMGK